MDKRFGAFTFVSLPNLIDSCTFHASFESPYVVSLVRYLCTWILCILDFFFDKFLLLINIYIYIYIYLVWFLYSIKFIARVKLSTIEIQVREVRRRGK